MKWSSFKTSSSIKNIGLLGITNVIGSAVSALFWLFLADLMGAENYGELGYFIGIASIATAFSTLGGQYVMTVYTAKNINIQPVLYLISLISSIIAAIACYVIFTNIGLSIYIVGHVIYSLVIAELLGHRIYKIYSTHFIVQKILMISLSLSLFFFIGENGVILGIGLSFLYLSFYIYKSFKTTKLDFQILKPRLKFVINNYILNFSKLFKVGIDKIIIAPLFGFEILGNYFLGLQVFSILVILPGVFMNYTLPEDSKGKLSTKNIKILAIIVSIVIAILGIIIVPEILPLFFPEYSDAISLIPIFSLAVIPGTITLLFYSSFLSEEKTNHLLISHFLTVISFILGIYLLGTTLGVVGLAWSLVIADSIGALYLALIRFKMKFRGNLS